MKITVVHKYNKLSEKILQSVKRSQFSWGKIKDSDLHCFNFSDSLRRWYSL